MIAFFDTSVLVPLFHTTHPHHEAGFAAILKHSRKQAYWAAHSMAEVYSSLTRMPPPLRVEADRALSFVEDLRSKLMMVSLNNEEYCQAISNFACQGITGGMVYDGLLIQCALKVKATTIYTWNVRHFRQFGPDVEKRLRTP